MIDAGLILLLIACVIGALVLYGFFEWDNDRP